MTDCTTAVVLAAGQGSRMRRTVPSARLTAAQSAAAERGIKGMIPDSRGRPFLDHVLSSLADSGVRDVCLVVGPDHSLIREHFELHPPARVTVKFIVQPAPTGTADALVRVESWCAGRDFITLNADNLYPVPAIRALVTLGAPGLVAFDREALIRHSNIDADRIGTFAVLDIDASDQLRGIVEKPGSIAPADWWISMNLWRFDSGIFACCRDVAPSPRGERELPLAVDLAISRGLSFRVVRMAEGVLDLSNRDDVSQVAARLGDREIQP